MTKLTEKDDDRLLSALARRNWYILAGLTLLSVVWQSMPVTKGVVAGGLLAILANGWRHRALIKTLSNPTPGAARGFQLSFIVRLAALGAAIFLLLVKADVHPLALTAGLSVVVINLLWTTVRRMF